MISATDAFNISQNYKSFDDYINTKILEKAEAGFYYVHITTDPYYNWLSDDYKMNVIENRIVDKLKEKGYIVKNLSRNDNHIFSNGRSLYIEWNEE